MINNMYKLFSLTLAALVFMALPAIAQKNSGSQLSTAITYSPDATHIGGITNDSVIIIAGSTYSFTVDSPEDGGLISTKLDIKQLQQQFISKDGSIQQYQLTNKEGTIKNEGEIETGDRLLVTAQNGKASKSYNIAVRPMAISGQLSLDQSSVTVNSSRDLTVYFTAGQRTPNATVKIYLPAGIDISLDNTTVNVIGRGDVKLKDIQNQSMGRIGSNYPYKKVGNTSITKSADGSSVLLFKHLDLRPANGPDLKIVISNVKLNKAGNYLFKANYSTTQPQVLTSAGEGTETATLNATNAITDFERVIDTALQYRETTATYSCAEFKWAPGVIIPGVQLQQSLDKGKTWKPVNAAIDIKQGSLKVSGLQPNKLYSFRLAVRDGNYKGFSNAAYFFSGKMDIKDFAVSGKDNEDNTEKINGAIKYLHSIGGGTLLFTKGIYSVRTVHLQSNVYLYIEKDATIKALKGNDAPETTWFSDKKYRSGLSPTDQGPYADPENWLTKQDVGHHYFSNCMFFGERINNVKIIGNGHITGNGNLVNGDNVMKNDPANRADKMFSLKLCSNIEIGGVHRDEDLWYDSTKDEPYYINKDGSANFDVGNMLDIDRGGHFVLLATGTDNLYVHDTYFARYNQGNARDVYDFMACNNVTATNIYSKVSSDDIIKPGSDCSLGFTRPAKKYRVRNIIGDTNCNLFQIGSETADDITDICVDNIYVLGANKAGFSISTNDGATIKDIHLNCGHTGKLHSRSKMLRTFTPFFISISNRGRILGANVSRFKFDENGVKHDELLVTNVSIGSVENIILNGVDISEVYAGSSYGDKNTRWKAYDGNQRRATSIIAGYSLPDTKAVEGGLNFTLPNGKHTGYINNITFNDVNLLVKGGNPLSDTAATPPELGVGQYNASNLKVQPAYGFWARHVNGFTVRASSLNYETRDSRYALFLDDVIGATILSAKMIRPAGIASVIKLKNSSNVRIENSVYYSDVWGNAPNIVPNSN